MRKSVESYLNTLGLLDQGETVPDDDDEVDRFCIAFDSIDKIIKMVYYFFMDRKTGGKGSKKK